ncbi:hypothetical protein ACVWZ6_002289 [Bradyrhizobium sp. GM6.1]
MIANVLAGEFEKLLTEKTGFVAITQMSKRDRVRSACVGSSEYAKRVLTDAFTSGGSTDLGVVTRPGVRPLCPSWYSSQSLGQYRGDT